MSLFLQLLLVLILILAGGFFSGSETGVYRLSRFKLRLGIEQKKTFYALLDKVMLDSRGLVFSILIGNNLVNYLSTSIVTLLLLRATQSENKAQSLTTLIMTPLLFIFSEVIPKNIYYYRSDLLMPVFAPVLHGFHILCKYSGLVWLLKSISNISSRWLKAPPAQDFLSSQRHRQIHQFLHESREEGILSSVQNNIMSRLINMPSIPILSVMTPIQKCIRIPIETGTEELHGLLAEHGFTRIPVYENNPDDLIGFVDLYEILSHEEPITNLKPWIQPISRKCFDVSVIEAIEFLVSRKEKVLLVTTHPSARTRVLGMVTMKDLVEELTGELSQW